MEKKKLKKLVLKKDVISRLGNDEMSRQKGGTHITIFTSDDPTMCIVTAIKSCLEGFCDGGGSNPCESGGDTCIPYACAGDSRNCDGYTYQTYGITCLGC